MNTNFRIVPIFMALAIQVIASAAFGVNCGSAHNLPSILLLDEAIAPKKVPFARLHYRKDPDGQNIKIAVVLKNQYQPAMETELRRQGYSGIAIRDPSHAEIENLNDFILGPEWVRPIMKTPSSITQWLADRSGSERSQLKRKMRASERPGEVTVELKDLTLRDYAIWHTSLFTPEILTLPGAIPGWPDVAAFAKRFSLKLSTDADLDQKIPNFQGIFFRNSNGELIGGNLIHFNETENSLTVRASAFAEAARAKYELGVRGMVVLIETAIARNIEYLSYGTDPNLFGMDASVGLAQFKAGLGMSMTPATMLPGYQLIKIFETSHQKLDSQSNPLYQGIVMFAIAGSGKERVSRYQQALALMSTSSENSQTTLDQKMKGLQGLFVGTQVGAAAGAPNAKLPAGMQLIRN